jgi:uncharacterized protein YbjT (DUF2867 family)
VVRVRVLVTGATGYIGGRLVPELLARGHEVRCLARTPAKLDGRPWRDEVEVVEGDVFDPASLDRASEGIDAVYYLVHSMDGKGDFAERDRTAAANVRDAAARAGVGRLVYLGGLGDDDEELSEHLRPATRSAGSSPTARSRSPSCGPRSSSAPGAPRSRCCATSSRCCR